MIADEILLKDLEEVNEYLFRQYKEAKDCEEISDRYARFLAVNYAIGQIKNEKSFQPKLDYDGQDVYRCGNCGAVIFHPAGTQADEDEKNYRKYCFCCGKRVKWE